MDQIITVVVGSEIVKASLEGVIKLMLVQGVSEVTGYMWNVFEFVKVTIVLS